MSCVHIGMALTEKNAAQVFLIHKTAEQEPASRRPSWRLLQSGRSGHDESGSGEDPRRLPAAASLRGAHLRAGARPDRAWLADLLAQGRTLYCGFDLDETGEAMAQAMIALHPSIQRLRPARKDWNDVLRSAL